MTRRAPLPLLTLALLLVAGSRLLRLDDLVMNLDEVWSIWQTFGSVDDILRWTPQDWPPLYYLILGAWSQVAGIQPLALRSLSALAFLPGAALTFRLAQRWRGWRAGLLALLAWSALGLVIRLSLEVRGYSLLLPLTMLSLWLTQRYFERPGRRRALALALTMTFMFYISYTGVMVILLLIAYSLIVYRRSIWRWWLPGLITALLVLPELLDIAGLVIARPEAISKIAWPPMSEAIAQLLVDFSGSFWPMWALLAVVALWLILRHERRQGAVALALILWALGMPFLVYLSNPLLGLFHGRYTWWIMPGIALMLARGLSWLPRRGTRVAMLLLAASLFAPIPGDSPYQIFDVLSPLEDNFRWLRGQMQWGDVLLTNDWHRCGAAEEWDYHLRAWLPNGLGFIDEPAGQRRIWVLNPDQQAPELRAQLAEDRIPGRFVGPWGCLMQLYEAAPDPQGIPYANGMRFHGAELMRGARSLTGQPVLHEGETLLLRMWWSADSAPARDFSVHTWLSREGRIYDEINGPPQPFWPPDAPEETSRWQPGSRYVELRELTLPLPAGKGSYEVNMKLYFWEDLEPVAAPGLGPNGERQVLSVKVRSY